MQCAASHLQDEVYQNHTRIRVGEERRATCICQWQIPPRYPPRTYVRRAKTTADTPFQKASPPSCALRCCIPNSNDAHKSRRVPRSTAARPTMHVDRLEPELHVAAMCIRLRSFPHLSSAFRSLRRLSNENRGRLTRLCNSRERRGAAACSHESRR